MRTMVKDVMTTQVASVNGSTPFKDVAEVLIAHHVSAVPVVDSELTVLGSRGQGGFEELQVGSAAVQVTAHLDYYACPIPGKWA